MMSALSEDELADSLTWSDQSFTLNEFVAKYSLPQVIRVVRGHDGGEDSATLGYGEVLTLHALRETPMLACEDKSGRAVAIRLDCPYKVKVLPQASDVKFNRCGVQDLPLLYPKVKFLEVIGAHYGTADNLESTNVGEVVEIVGIEKKQKKVKVKNPETNEQITLSSNCTSEFMPLLDWKSYSVKELKNHFSFPIRVRFMVGNEASDDETLGLMSKVLDFNVLNEFREVLVITTTTSSCVDLKFCYEVPNDLDVKVEVAEGFLHGDRHYQDVVATLKERFDVSRFMNTQSFEICKRSGIIKSFDYESHKELFLDITPRSKDVTGTQDESPVLPPRRKPVCKTISAPAPPPDVPGKKPPMQKLVQSTDDDGYPRPAIAPRPKPRCQSTNDAIEKENLPNPATSRLKEGSYPTASIRPQTPPSSDDPSAAIYTYCPVNLSKDPPPQPTFQSAPNLPAEGKPEGAKPPPVLPRGLIPSDPSKPPVTVPRAPKKTDPDRSEQSPNPSNDPKPPPQSPPSVRPPPKIKIPQGARMVLPQLPTHLRSIAQPATNQTTEKPEQIRQHREVPENEENPTKDDDSDNYEELAPPVAPTEKIFQPTISSDADGHGVKLKNDFIMVKPETAGTEWKTESPYAVVARVPQDLSSLTVNDVSALLSNLNMGCYVKKFQNEMIDGNLLKSLDEEELQSLDVSAFHIKKLTRFINGWRPKV